MAQQKGSISIDAQNIMPVIKKWLYSDKDIFLREIVSNGCDAIAKYKMLVMGGEAPEESNYRIDVVADRKNGCITVSDNGLGMTAEEVRKFIAQVAFSGATEFLEKYKKEEEEKGGIIGHFGLGFYSAFMVSKKVQIDTKSWRQDAPAVRWFSEDGLEYEMEDSDRAGRGTTITMYLNEDEHEFLHLHTLREVLEKYCGFMAVPIFLSEVKEETEPAEVQEGEEKAEEKPAEPQQINEPHPLWLKKPSEVTDEEYRAFYHKVFHDYEEPLFWIHLNAEYPFNLKGILYFPKIKNEFSSAEGQIKLFSGQVFVADNIKEVIPEFLMLLKGVIDCPELPLNVSRSFLQNDGYVKKVSAYITRKVADRLMSEYNTRREDYQKYWDDIHPFVKYGCIRDEKFYERVKDALLFKTVEGEYLTLKEYLDKNCAEGEKTVFYCSDAKRQAQMVELYRQQGKDVVLLDTMIDANFISFLEYQEKDGLKFSRVDAGLEGLTEGGEQDEEARKALEARFRKAVGDDALEVKLESLKSEEMPAMITVEEQSRRFSEMSRNWGGGFAMPEKRTLVLNSKNSLVSFLKGAPEDEETTRMVCCQIMDLAEMSRQPLESERMIQFLKRSNQLLNRLAEKL